MRRPFLSLVLCQLILASCATETVTPVSGIFEMSAINGSNFFDMPWPNDLRTTDAGNPLMANFPNPSMVPIIRAYTRLITAEIQGFSVSAPIYFRFDGAIDPESLPATGADSLVEGSSVFLIDIDPESPSRLERRPVITSFVEAPALYWPGNALVVRPVHGIPLRGRTTYAAVVTTALRDTTGQQVVRAPQMAQILGLELATTLDIANAAVAHQPALAALSEVGVAPESIVSLSVFTTQDPTGELMQMRDFVDTLPAPELVTNSTRYVRVEDGYQLLHGLYMSPMFMEGEVPFTTSGGKIIFGDDGVPVQQGEFEVRFAVTLPTDSEMPASGWPVILYAHGTGGDYETFVGETSKRAAALGYAMMGIDQIHHGPRNPTAAGPEGLVFNFANPQAFRNNTRQSAVDVMAMARFAAERPLDPRAVGPGVFFDREQMYFYGHSQGGLNGPPYLATDDTVRGAVLSGAGGLVAIALVDKTEPLNIPAVVNLVLGLNDVAAEQITYDHPSFAMLSLATDVSDPTNYAHLIVDTPRPGFAPKSILMTQGLTDPFTPPRSIEGLATAMRIPTVTPVLEPSDSAALVGLTPVDGPVQGNVRGEATVGLLQYPGGHFVAFDPDARDRIDGFFESALLGIPVIQ